MADAANLSKVLVFLSIPALAHAMDRLGFHTDRLSNLGGIGNVIKFI